jgi:hypothetical protein
VFRAVGRARRTIGLIDAPSTCTRVPTRSFGSTRVSIWPYVPPS